MKKTIYWFLTLPELEVELLRYCRAFCGNDQEHYLKHLYVIHWILYNKRIFPEIYENRGILINRDKLAKEKLRVRNDVATDILNNLLSWQFIDKVENHREGRSRTFRINMRWEANSASLKPFVSKDAYFIGQLIKGRNEAIKGSQLIRKQFQILSDKIRVGVEGITYLREKYQDPFLTHF